MSEFIGPGEEGTQEKEKQPEIIESVARGAEEQTFAPGVLVRDGENRLAHIVSFVYVADTTKYGREDPSVRRPQKLRNPIFTIRYEDGEEATIGPAQKMAAVFFNEMAKIKEDEAFFNESHLEIRGHVFKLGELVSFGNQIGTLAIIYGDGTIGISAREVWGKLSPRHLYRVNIDEVDFIERENGDIKKNPDGTIFKPTLG